MENEELIYEWIEAFGKNIRNRIFFDNQDYQPSNYLHNRQIEDLARDFIKSNKPS